MLNPAAARGVPAVMHPDTPRSPGPGPQPGRPAGKDAGGPPGQDGPLGYVIVIRHPGHPLCLTDESLWTLEECQVDAPQAEADIGGEAIICAVVPVRGDCAALYLAPRLSLGSRESAPGRAR